MINNILNKLPFILLTSMCFFNATSAYANSPDTPFPFNVTVGTGAIFAPAFLGSRDYQLSAFPNLEIKYKNWFFMSMQDGLGFNIINSNGWCIGPVMKYAFPRNQTGQNPFRVLGGNSNALQGLGNVPGTIEVGGFAKYNYHSLSAKLEMRQGINGRNGFITQLNANYSKDIHTLLYTNGPPLILSLGPHATVTSRNYNQAYFGITPFESAQSGLPTYNASQGLLTYGVGATTILPVSKNLLTVLVAGYDRLANSAANSPLVRERGSRNQLMTGLFFSYALRY